MVDDSSSSATFSWNGNLDNPVPSRKSKNSGNFSRTREILLCNVGRTDELQETVQVWRTEELILEVDKFNLNAKSRSAIGENKFVEIRERTRGEMVFPSYRATMFLPLIDSAVRFVAAGCWKIILAFLRSPFRIKYFLGYLTRRFVRCLTSIKYFLDW